MVDNFLKRSSTQTYVSNFFNSEALP